MERIINEVMEMLDDDMVSHGSLVQCVEQSNAPTTEQRSDWNGVLRELLFRQVEIGDAKKDSEDYVKFIAWQGNVDERIVRASTRVDKADTSDREFAYWLCLRENVDHFESNEI